MKIKLSLVLILLLAFSLSLGASAAETDELFESQIEASGADSLFGNLGRDEKELLEKLGIDELSFDSVFSASPRKIFDLFFEIIRNEYSSPVSALAPLLAMVIALAAFGQFVPQGHEKTVDFIACISAALCVLVPLSQAITRVLSAVKISSGFVTALIPVLAAVISVSGNPTLALSFNSLAFAVAQLVSKLGESVIRPLAQTVFSLSVISAVSDAVNIKAIVEFAKKTAIFIMSFSATVFVTMLTIKGMLAASADTVAVRGIRFLIGNMIPIVGGAVSDAYLSIVGTLSLVKNTVGVFAIAVITVINLPVLIECVLWIFGFGVLAAVGDLFSQTKLSSLFRCISSAVVLLTVTLLFEVLVFVLSVGLILVIKGGG